MNPKKGTNVTDKNENCGSLDSASGNDTKRTKTIKFTTNTAWLLNMWFPEWSDMFNNVREFVREAHDKSWKGENSSFVEVTFKIKDVDGQ